MYFVLFFFKVLKRIRKAMEKTWGGEEVKKMNIFLHYVELSTIS